MLNTSSSRFFLRSSYLLALITVVYFSGCTFLNTSPGTESVESISPLRQQIVDFADDFVGTKYRYAGTDPRGFDCSGFTTYVFDKHDIALNRRSRDQEAHGVKIPWQEAQAGDLLFFRRSKSSNVFHVSLVISNSAEGIKVVHATSSRGVVIDNISTSSYWSKKFITARKILP